MLNRYNDIEKFITDSSKLELNNGCEVYISSEENYDIVVDLDKQADQFETLKPYLTFVAKNICMLDNIAQNFDRWYHKGTQHSFPYEVQVVSIDEPNMISLTYWGTVENTEFDVVFEHQDNGFVLKSFGMLKSISPFWDREK